MKTIFNPHSNNLQKVASNLADIGIAGSVEDLNLTLSIIDDGATPVAPTGLTASGAIQYILLEWTQNTETDISYYEIWRSETNDSGTATRISNVQGISFIDGDLPGDTRYYYWIKAVDYMTNISPFSTSATAITRNVTNVDIAALAVDTEQIALGAIEEGKIAAAAVTAAKTAVNAIDSTTGDITADHIIAGMLQTGCVVSSKIYADAVTAVKLNVVGIDGTTGRIVVTDATDTDMITGAINTHATTLVEAGKITLSGETTLDDWGTTVADVTYIDGGTIYTNSILNSSILSVSAPKVLIDGVVYLSNWQKTGDVTKIDGGEISAGSVTADQITVASLSALQSLSGNIKTAATGARLEIFPDSNTGLVIYDQSDNEVFKAYVGGAGDPGTGDIVIGDYANNKGLLWDKSATTFYVKGSLIAGSGSSVDGTYLVAGSVTSAKAKIALKGWTHDLTFSSTDYNTVAWTSGTITLSDASTYSIVEGNTGNMAAITYIYLDIDVSITVLQTTTTSGDAIGDGKILIAVANVNDDATSDATFQVFGGKGGLLLTTENLAANTITANEVLANTITGSEITGTTLSGVFADLGTITAGNITLNSSGFIRTSGKDNYADATAGIWFGYDTDKYKLNIGSATNYLKWDGTNLNINGVVTIGAGSSYAGDSIATTYTAAKCIDANADQTSVNTAANITSQGDLATTNEVDANVLNMTNAPAAANADVTQTIIDGGMITTGYITLGTAGRIKSGQTAYNTGTGFWLGDVSGTPKFSIGVSSGNYMTWDGSDLNIKGNLIVDNLAAINTNLGTVIAGMIKSGATNPTVRLDLNTEKKLIFKNTSNIDMMFLGLVDPGNSNYPALVIYDSAGTYLRSCICKNEFYNMYQTGDGYVKASVSLGTGRIPYLQLTCLNDDCVHNAQLRLTASIPTSSSSEFEFKYQGNSTTNYLKFKNWDKYHLDTTNSTIYLELGNASSGISNKNLKILNKNASFKTHLLIDGGIHIGGDSDPGDNNLVVEGNISLTDSTKHILTHRITAKGSDGLRFYDSANKGSKLFWTAESTFQATQTIIPNGTGDVLYALQIRAMIRDSTGALNSPSLYVTPGNNTVLITGLTLYVNANGSVTIARTSGALSYKVALDLLWL